MAVCPKCGSHHFSYELRSAGTKSITRYYRTGVKKSWIVPAGKRSYTSSRMQKTVGFCPDCGYMEQPKSGWWYLLLILFFPISLSVWFYKTERIDLAKKWKIVIIAAVWIVVYGLLIFGGLSAKANGY